MVHQSNLTNFATWWFGTPKQTLQWSTRLPRFSQTERGNLTQRLTLWDKLLGLGKVLKLTILFVIHAGRLNSKHWLQKKEVKSDTGWCTSMSKEPIASKPAFYFTDFSPHLCLMESFRQAQDDSLECTRWPEDISSRGCIYARHVYASLAVFVDQPWMFVYISNTTC